MGASAKRWLDPALVAGVALLYVVPLAMSRYFPGLDLPWHAAVVEILHTHDSAEVVQEFLGYYQVQVRFSSYVTMYYVVDALAFLTGDVAVAMQLLIAIYVVAFVWSARRLVRSFGGAGYIAVLAAPAAYSLTLEYGFLAYALTYPLTFWTWALVRELCAGAKPHWRYPTVAALSVVVALTHPFAAFLAVVGALLIVIAHVGLARFGRLGWTALLSLAGAVPLGIALSTMSGASGSSIPVILQRASLWTRMTTQQFSSIDESIAAAPVRLFGFAPVAWCFALAALGLIAAVISKVLATPTIEQSAPDPAGRRAVALLLGAALAAYALTPYTFEWPWRWYAAQPRLLPLVWVLALVALRPAAGKATVRVVAAPLAFSALALSVMLVSAFLPFASEAADFRAVVSSSAPRVRTLGLIEHPRAPERAPANPWRHATAYILVEHGGFVSNLPMTRFVAGNAGALVPVTPADHPPPVPRSPPPGYPRSFDWERHGAGWDQFLIRDSDPAARFDYFRDHAAQVELVSERGRWRLYRRRSSNPLP